MQGNVLGQSGGGSKINGIIEEYRVASGGNVNAGDFVEYLNGTTMTVGTDSQTSYGTNSGEMISAVKLTDTSVFIAHRYENANKLYGRVCTISGTTITGGTDTQLSTAPNSGYMISVVTLSSSKVFIAHSYSDYSGSDSYKLYGMVCTINGTTITTGTDTLIDGGTNSGNYISASAISSTSVFIAFRGNGLGGRVCTINGTTITAGTFKQLSSSSNAGDVISTVKLSSSKVLIAHSLNDYLYGMVCTVSGTTITAGTDTQLSNISYTGGIISAVSLLDNKIFIAHRYYSNSSFYLYGMVCTVNGTTITAGTDTQLSTDIIGASTASVALLSSSKVLVIFNHLINSAYYLYGIICEISDTTITIGTDTQLNTYSSNGDMAIAVVSSTQSLIAYGYSSNKYLYTKGVSILEGVRQITNLSQIIIGVAKENGSAGDTIDVYVPDVS